MKKTFRNFLETSLILMFSVGPIWVPIPVFASSKGTVDVVLEWHTQGQTFTYVFTGMVSSQGRPCPNAKVQLHLNTPGQQDRVHETVANSDGTYELKVAIAGNPEEFADWKLVAQGPESIAETAEIEGRTILTEGDETVVVQRPLQLIQG